MKRIIKATTMAAAGCALMVGGAGSAMAHGGGASADGVAAHSPGVLSGNLVQVPVSVPINLCGNTVNVIAALNPTFGNTCINK
ncbi:chaplin [Streptomyces sp. 549]|uniref:chaplin n=1 Tax=Streptomyces sp. 549 TaxID=3049076 RepID=UPI0024C3EEAC|nr:chaplin [Streptomyces sp. 549]MDK1473577.1 chaplin [Streptomyces sp. 549]